MRVEMVPFGGAGSVKDIVEPFFIKKGWKPGIRMTVHEAEQLVEILQEMLADPRCRKPKTIRL
jgi:hypothetical protein